MGDWTITDADRRVYERELAAWIPERIFDAHTHLYDAAHFAAGRAPELVRQGQSRVGLDELRAALDRLTPGRRYGGLCFGFPAPGIDQSAANAFLAREVASRAGWRAQLLVHPHDAPEAVRAALATGPFVGLKCYHVYSDHQPTFESRIEGFLPDRLMELADELALAVTLHIVRARGLADPQNQATLIRYSKQFPRARIILAHAARGFNSWHTSEGIAAVAGLENLWFDTSAVTEPGALQAVLRTFSYRRLLYGSDFPVSHLRGRCVTIGDTFVWLHEKDLPQELPYARVEPVLVGLESLRALRDAALAMQLSDAEVRAIFHDNAAEMFACEADTAAPDENR